MIYYLRPRKHACQNTVYHHMVFFKGYVRCWRPGPTVRNAVSSSSPYYRLSLSGWRSQTCLLSPHRITQHEIGPLVNGQKVSSLIYRGKCIAVQYMLGSLTETTSITKRILLTKLGVHWSHLLCASLSKLNLEHSDKFDLESSNVSRGGLRLQATQNLVIFT